MGSRASSCIITWVNLLTVILSLGIFSLGIWLATRHGDCEKNLTSPTFIIGAFIFIISLVGFVGAWRDIPSLLRIYLILMFLLVAAIVAFTIFIFVVTHKGAGHLVNGKRFEEYKLIDYSNFLQNVFGKEKNWRLIRSCFVHNIYCESLSKNYHSVNQYNQAKLSSIQSGCCRPPFECGYAMKNANYFNLSSRPHSSDPDCMLYKNDHDIKCYNCNSCKAGVAQVLKKRWWFVAIFDITTLSIIILLYSIGCCARRYASSAHYSKV
ncbi:hypothetical protein O6H91_03G026900 [Diphasiastrum complanatum]|uniref:Uncharacterized protein n=1 Tax=Diphasiastrum complanatum TaxID=34168 RepID=A0ACC2E4G4_DIPCM|nr:hypothetical protein O6H91_03G026900 [Diphasiastrum complanatum]